MGIVKITTNIAELCDTFNIFLEQNAQGKSIAGCFVRARHKPMTNFRSCIYRAILFRGRNLCVNPAFVQKLSTAPWVLPFITSCIIQFIQFRYEAT